MRSLKIRVHISKQVLNSPILINNHELDSIEMIKGLFHRELKYLLGNSSNSIKSNDELR